MDVGCCLHHLFFPPSFFQKVCTKCGIETFGAQKRPLWLCKICSEQREVKCSIVLRERGLHWDGGLDGVFGLRPCTGW